MDIDIQPGVIARVAGILRDKLEQWFPPLRPLPRVAPQGTPPRRFDYEVGVNIQIQPKLSVHWQLRELADNYDLLRLVIETFKDHLVKIPWVIRPIAAPGQKRPKATGDPRIGKLTALFNCPDGEQPWDLWLRALLEDLLVIDAPAIEPILTRGGELVRLDLIDGATIAPKIAYDGRIPKPPEVAYQQIVKGAPTVEFTADELIYYPRNRRTHKIYGFSPVEQIQVLVNLALRREMWLLNFFTEGSVPEAYISVPETWTPSQIKEAQDAFDGYLAGNLKNRRKMILGPGRSSGNAIQMLKADAIGGDAILDELIVRLICFAFDISPQALVKMMNRATAQTAKAQAAEEGMLPLMMYFSGLFNLILRKYCQAPDLEFAWRDEKEEDTGAQAEILQTYISLGVMTVNEGRNVLGLEPVEGGNVPLVYSAQGPVPLSQAGQQQATTPQGGAQAGVALASSPAGPGSESCPGGTAAESLPRDERGDGSATKPGRTSGNGGRETGNVPGETGNPPRRSLGKKDAAPGSYEAVATAEQRAAEGRIRELLAVFFAEQAAKLVEAYPPDDRKPLDWDEDAWAGLAPAISLQLRTGFEQAAQQALDALPISKDDSPEISEDEPLDINKDDLWKKVQPHAAEFANARAAELVAQIADTTRNTVAVLVQKSLEEDLTPQQFKDVVEQYWLFSPERAELIAETELIGSHTRGTLAAWTQSGLVPGYKWVCDGRPCVTCAANGASRPVEIGERFPSGHDGPPVHPRCQCALSPVLIAPRGPKSRHRLRQEAWDAQSDFEFPDFSSEDSGKSKSVSAAESLPREERGDGSATEPGR
jgi:hypothetical protein